MRPPLIVFEHEAVYVGQGISKTELGALQAFHGDGKGFPYYRLIHEGIRFRSYVGVIRVGELTIEILPKTDNNDNNDDENYWRSRLFDMLRVAHDLPLHTPTTSHQRSRPLDVLHLYLELFLGHCERLHRRGLHRAYRTERTNATALSGRLLMAEHLRHNLVHKERFFVARDRFDFDAPLNRVLGHALREAARLNGNRALRSRFQSLLEAWPELPDVRVAPATFDRLRFPRGTEGYRPAVAIARLILLRHAPDRRGGRDLPALLFNMNRLWEVFLERTLLRELPEYTVSGQEQTDYYFPERGSASVIKPDIVLRDDAGNCKTVLDAKWKVPNDLRPSSTDLQQMYTYVHRLNANRVVLLYPGNKEARPSRSDAGLVSSQQVQGWFGEERGEGKPCAVVAVPLPAEVESSLVEWMSDVGKAVAEVLAPKTPVSGQVE